MTKLASISIMALCATVAVVGLTGAAKLAAITPPIALSTGDGGPHVNRAGKDDRLAGSSLPWEVARGEKGDRELSAVATQIAGRVYTVESSGYGPGSGASGKSNLDQIVPSESASEFSDAREDRLPQTIEVTTTPAWDGTTGLIIQPVADTSMAATNFAAQGDAETMAVEPERSYSQDLAERTERRVVYLWDLLKASIGVH